MMPFRTANQQRVLGTKNLPIQALSPISPHVQTSLRPEPSALVVILQTAQAVAMAAFQTTSISTVKAVCKVNSCAGHYSQVKPVKSKDTNIFP